MTGRDSVAYSCYCFMILRPRFVPRRRVSAAVAYKDHQGLAGIRLPSSLPVSAIWTFPDIEQQLIFLKFPIQFRFFHLYIFGDSMHIILYLINFFFLAFTISTCMCMCVCVCVNKKGIWQTRMSVSMYVFVYITLVYMHTLMIKYSESRNKIA